MPPRKVLITGGTGLLGKTLLEHLPPQVEALATFHRLTPPEAWRQRFRRLDVRQEGAVLELFKEVRPEVVVHTASVGGVDEAQRDPESVRAVNVGGTRAVLSACRKTGARLVYISSNAVFDGTAPPYAEDAPLKAVNRYGQVKIEAERLVRSGDVECLIVRPILMYGWPLEGGRENAVTRWLRQLEKKEPVRVADDLVSMPLWAGDCARAVWTGVLRDKKGVVHVAGGDRVTLTRFAEKVCELFGHDPGLLRPLPSRQFRELAPRPRDTSFDLTRLREDFGMEPLALQEGLARMKESRVSVLTGQGF